MSVKTKTWIDVHAHLADIAALELAALVSEAADAGVEAVVNTATSMESSAQVVRQHAVHPSLLPAVGISPFDTASLMPGWEHALDDLLSRPDVIACGETGLDATNPAYPPQQFQIPSFEQHLALAKKHGKPVIIHSRGCEADAVNRCRAAGVEKALFHCFTGDMAALRLVLDNGYHVSFSGIVTFNSRPLDTQVSYAPVDRLFIETDSPYLAPVPHRGRPNRPAWAALVGEAVARKMGIAPDVLARQIRSNFTALFGVTLPEA